MPRYMLLLYANEGDEAERAERWAQMPLWNQLTEGLREAGLLVDNAPLHPAGTATTVRVRGGRTELTDGPYAVTKEILVGYYLLECAELDEALKAAAALPTASFGSVEVRPVMSPDSLPGPTAPPKERD